MMTQKGTGLQIVQYRCPDGSNMMFAVSQIAIRPTNRISFAPSLTLT